MLIVLEGCDGAGKTTIANQLKRILPDAEVIHCTRNTPNNIEFFDAIIQASLNKNIIADRFCYGQFVYQECDERHLNTKDLNLLEAHMLSAGAKVVYVTAPVEEIASRLNMRGEQASKPIGDICDRYLHLFEEVSIIKPIVWWTGRDE